MAAQSSIDALVAELGLEAHPEGGFFKRWYTAPQQPACATSIIYLLPAGATSSLHRLRSDELWFHQRGDNLDVIQVARDGAVSASTVAPGAPLAVPAGALFGAELRAGGAAGYALVACVVVPGFKWEDFELPSREALRAEFAGAGAECLAAIERLGAR